MPNLSRIPLQVFQVLEEEYRSIHGPLEEVEIKLQQRSISAKLDWRFYDGHIKQPGVLKSKLSNPYGLPEPDKNLFLYLKAKINALALPIASNTQLTEGPSSGVAKVEGQPALEKSNNLPETKPLEEILNQLLLTDFYDAEAFKHVELRDIKRALLKAYPPYRHWSLVEEEGQESESKAQRNRYLLEDIFRDELETIHNIRLAAMHHRLHAKEQAALCLSGGGIRSGTFALGLIQGLARKNLLKRFDYMSTVSGGGYIGGWLTAWLHRDPRGLDGVTEQLKNSNPESKIDPEPPPIQHLRSYSNYLTPKAGLLSADTWTFLAIYLRNLFLNWIVILPLLLMVLAIPRLNVSIIVGGTEDPAVWVSNVLVPVSRLLNLLLTLRGATIAVRHILLALGFVLGVMALSYVGFNRPGVRAQLKEHSPFWRERTDQRSFLRWCLLPLLGSAFLSTSYWAWSRYAHYANKDNETVLSKFLVFILFGLGLPLISWLISSLVLGRFFSRSKGAQSTEWSRTPTEEGRKRILSTFLTEVAIFELAGLLGAMAMWAVAYFFNDIIVDMDTVYNLTHRLNINTLKTELYACFAVPLFLTLIMLATTFFIGFSSQPQFKWTNDEDREWWARFNAWLLIATLAWSVFSVLVIFGPLLLINFPRILGSVGSVSGLIVMLVGHSSKTPANKEKQAREGGVSAWMSALLPLLAMLFIAVVIAAASLLTSRIIIWVSGLLTREVRGRVIRTDYLEWLSNIYSYRDYVSAVSGPLDSLVHLRTVHYPSFWFISLLMLLFGGLGFVLARTINLNIFSLHGGYRNRLIRGYLAASRIKRERQPDPFTDFDPDDNVQMHELRPALFHDEVDFRDLEGLALKLKKTESAETQYLYDNYISEETKRLLVEFIPPARLSQRLKVALVEDLNRVLEDEKTKLYEDGHLKHLLKTDTARQVIEEVRKDNRSEYHILLNRLVLEQVFPKEIKPGRYPPPPYRLFHVINMTLNLVGGDNLAWQQRKAESFTVNPLHSGCFRLGYRRSRDYGGPDGISLGTAFAISGAAASSNMGYFTTSPVISLVMTLFNVRLGWWLGNPGSAGSGPLLHEWNLIRRSREYAWRTYGHFGEAVPYRRSAPKYSVLPIVAEAFGMTNDKSEYVYLSDGGHFENLALYEMVLRRVKIIVVSDAAQDENYEFNDLGNAVRKIRIDLGVPIVFEKLPVNNGEKKDEDSSYYAIAKILYSEIDEDETDGILIYIKPAVYGDEPQDVLNYKKAHSQFPNETTADQFFSEPQFESYRMLGSHAMDRILEDVGEMDSNTQKISKYESVSGDSAKESVKDSLTIGGMVFRASYHLKKADPKQWDWVSEWLTRRDERIKKERSGARG